MFRLPFIISGFALLAACDSPSPGFLGTDPTRATVAGHTYSVRQKDTRVEAIRMSRTKYLSGAVPNEITVAAIEKATGCTVTPSSIRGSSYAMKAEVKCSATR